MTEQSQWLILVLLVLGNGVFLAMLWRQSRSSAEPQQAELREMLRGIMLQEFRETRAELHQGMRDNRLEMAVGLKDFRAELTELQRSKFQDLVLKQEELVKMTESKLERMRETVDEKLHKTLEERLGQSFKIVSERLEAVQRGLGEMQNLAQGVGDLKKVLTNVKTRGVVGEIALGSILEQLLSPEQYDANVKTKKGSNDHVEFAVRLPGLESGDGPPVYLPIDAKFPQEDYLRLQQAYELGDVAAVDGASRALAQAVKKFAKDIRDKYIDPPNTTDFGIMFLPMEGLFAEVVRQPDLVAQLQREFQIIVTGPTTLAAMLNSLQMGFRTLAIQKRSSEVWRILGAVKSEFGKFGGVLEKAQKKLLEANQEIDTLVGTRTRMLLSKLKNVEAVEGRDAAEVLGDDGDSAGA